MRSDLESARHALAYVMRSAFRDRRQLRFDLRALGKVLLDSEFEATCPIRPLPSAWLDALLGHEVVLPPSNLFEPGNQDRAGLSFLVSVAAWLDASEIFEIGTYNGLTAYTLARNLPNAIVHTLDLPSDQLPDLPLFTGDQLHIRDRDTRVYERLPLGGRIRQLEGDSGTFDFTPYRRRCALVYVDGAHSTEYVLSDSENALAIAAERGAIVWDDFSRGMRGVTTALCRLADELPLYRVPETRLVVHLTSAVQSDLGG